MPQGVLRIQLFQSTLSDEWVNSTWQDRMVLWVFVGILHIDVEEIYKYAL